MMYPENQAKQERQLPVPGDIMARSSQLFPLVSVIIPVYNDCQRLLTCLRSLQRQSYPQHCYQIIVIDNNSQEDIAGIVANFANSIYVLETKRGAYAARNSGIAIAGGEIIAFTDADCIADTDWIGNGVAQLLRDPDCGLLAGKIKVFARRHRHPSMVELLEIASAFDQEHYLRQWHFSATANLFTRRQVLATVGIFDERLLSGGDLQWGQRVYACGYRQIYAENVVVWHPALYNFGQLYRKHRRVITGLYAMQTAPPTTVKQTLQKLFSDFRADWPTPEQINAKCRSQRGKNRSKLLLAMLILKAMRYWLRLGAGKK